MPSATDGVGSRGSAESHGDVGSRGGAGARLRSARERAGLTLIQASEKLHIDPGMLEALETERFEQLGAPVYVRGYLRHYAHLVGESEAELQELYAATADAARVPDLTRFPRAETASTSGPLLFPGVVVVIAVALIGTAWWISGNLGGSKPQRGGVISRLGSAQVAAPARSVPVAGQDRVTGGTPRPQRQSSAPVPRAEAAPTPAAQGAAQALAQGPAQGPPVQGPAQGLAQGTAPPAEPHLRASALTMHFSEDSWTEVYDARGERLFYDVGYAGSTRTVRGVPPLRVVLGNPPEVALQLDGRSVAVPGAPRNVITEFRVARSGRVAPMRLASAERGGSEDRRRASPQETH